MGWVEDREVRRYGTGETGNRAANPHHHTFCQLIGAVGVEVGVVLQFGGLSGETPGGIVDKGF